MYITTIYHNNCTLYCRKLICMAQVRPCPIWDAILSLLVWPIPSFFFGLASVRACLMKRWYRRDISVAREYQCQFFFKTYVIGIDIPWHWYSKMGCIGIRANYLCSRYLCMARRWGANGFTRLVIFTIFRWLEVDTSLLGFVILQIAIGQYPPNLIHCWSHTCLLVLGHLYASIIWLYMVVSSRRVVLIPFRGLGHNSYFYWWNILFLLINYTLQVE